MAKIPSKVESRIKEALKRYQPLVEQAKSRDVGEAETRRISPLLFAIVASTPEGLRTAQSN